MAQVVCSGAQLMCSFGAAPSVLTVLPVKQVNTAAGPAACITDTVTGVNLKPFGMCSSLANPTVATATAAASGVLTPMPCVPLVPAPWTPGSPTVLVGGQPVIDQLSKCMCAYGGVVTVALPGQFTAVV